MKVPTLIAGKNRKQKTQEELWQELQNKPFSQWAKQDLDLYREFDIRAGELGHEYGLLEAYEVEDYRNNWVFEIVDNALVYTRIAPPPEEMMLGLAKPTTDLVVGHCRICGLDSLAADDTLVPAEIAARQQRKIELQRRLHRDRNVPGQELETIPRRP